MKKKYILALLIITAGITITPFIFIATIPKYYIQVNNNDEFIWSYNVYQPSYSDFRDDTSDLFNYRNLENVDRIKIDIENISSEIVSGDYKYKKIGIDYYTAQGESSNDWTLNSSINSIRVYNYKANNYKFLDIIQGPLIISANVNWKDLATVLETEADQIKDLDSYQITPLYNGLNIVLDYNYTETITENLQYNDKGVLSSLTINYSDIVTIEQTLDHGIDGYSLSILMLFCVPSIIGIISVLLKKMREFN